MFDDGMKSCLDKNRFLHEIIESLQVERDRHLQQIYELKKELELYKD